MHTPPWGESQRLLSGWFCASASALLLGVGNKACLDAGDLKQSHRRKAISSDASSCGGSKLIFLGTGSSTGCPRPLCTMVFQQHLQQLQHQLQPKVDLPTSSPYSEFCKTSIAASAIVDPRLNKNYRNNPSVIISIAEDTGSNSHVLIDAGKTFREAALRWFPVHGVNSLDAIILTHEHMDAAGGLDDVRGFQQWTFCNGARGTALSMPLFLSRWCYDKLQNQFPWLLPHTVPPVDALDGSLVNSQSGSGETQSGSGETQRGTSFNSNNGFHKTGKEGAVETNISVKQTPIPVVQRYVASFDVHVFQPFQEVTVLRNPEGNSALFSVVPLPVKHGEDLISFGFAFTVNQTSVLYLSDISRMLPETMDFIRDHLPPTDVLILDTLQISPPNPVHYSLSDAVVLAQQLQTLQEGKNGTETRKPIRVLLVGMNCDAFPLHDDMNQYLRISYGKNSATNPNLDIQFAHDGLVIDL